MTVIIIMLIDSYMSQSRVIMTVIIIMYVDSCVTHASGALMPASGLQPRMRVVGRCRSVTSFIYAAAGDAHEQAVPVTVVSLKLKWLPAFVP
jgi:hypothetical protein